MDFLKFSRTRKSVEKQAAPVAQLDRAPDYGSFMDHFVVVRKFTNTYYKQGKS